ncbi:MAG: TlpA family protein disulfide reductase [Planctomycetes bacterium]|nr:TlpA family protein disulfide reductase [Planctomycetota bacterium]
MLELALTALLAQAPAERPLELGNWRAHLVSPGGELRFDLVLLRAENGAWRAQVRNEPEVLDVPSVAWSDERRELTLEFPHYDSRITASADADGDELAGVWRKRKGADKWSEMRFAARRYQPYEGRSLPIDEPGRLEQAAWPNDASQPSFFGTWRAQFASDSAPSVAVWRKLDRRSTSAATGADFSGTFLTTLGDYRFLAGRFNFPAEQLTLSCFDGAHAFLFKAKLLEDGSLAGDFWSGDAWHDTWTAVRDDQARLPDPFGLTKLKDGVKLDELAFPDLEGVSRKLGEAQFAGKARVVQLFGTWCPNCNDETRYLAELHERYGARGLSILGLAFELTGDFTRDSGQVRKYATHHKIRYPLLVAGVSDKQKASERFPLLDKVRAYPTTLFVDSKGDVRAVHQGFSGPATGAAHLKLREDFERLIETLLAETK